MAELAFYVGRYVTAAKSRFLSRRLSVILRHSKLEVEDLTVILEEIHGRFVEIALSVYGPWFLYNLFRRCEACGLEREIEALFSDLINEDVILHRTGLEKTKPSLCFLFVSVKLGF